MAPRLVKQRVEIGGRSYPVGVALVPNAYLVHHDPTIYPDPYAFRPERFVDASPGTYTWIPFGGGRRRCLGASFAMLEMRVVLRTLLTARKLRVVADPLERPRRRNITIKPGQGGVAWLPGREPPRVPTATEPTRVPTATEPARVPTATEPARVATTP